MSKKKSIKEYLATMVTEKGEPVLNEARLPIYWNSGVAKKFASQRGAETMVVKVRLTWEEVPAHPPTKRAPKNHRKP